MERRNRVSKLQNLARLGLDYFPILCEGIQKLKMLIRDFWCVRHCRLTALECRNFPDELLTIPLNKGPPRVVQMFGFFDRGSHNASALPVCAFFVYHVIPRNRQGIYIFGELNLEVHMFAMDK